MRHIIIISVLVLVAGISAALGAESTSAKIQSALSAAPDSIKAGATVADIDAHGKMTVLRKGDNGFTCLPGYPGVVGVNPICGDRQSMIWMSDFMAHKPKPTNSAPGIMYMLAGGTDWSASDPYAMKGTPIVEPPHWMIMWPYDPKASGLSSKESHRGTWIMYAGTPWAHLMINQKP